MFSSQIRVYDLKQSYQINFLFQSITDFVWSTKVKTFNDISGF